MAYPCIFSTSYPILDAGVDSGCRLCNWCMPEILNAECISCQVLSINVPSGSSAILDYIFSNSFLVALLKLVIEAPIYCSTLPCIAGVQFSSGSASCQHSGQVQIPGRWRFPLWSRESNGADPIFPHKGYLYCLPSRLSIECVAVATSLLFEVMTVIIAPVWMRMCLTQLMLIYLRMQMIATLVIDEVCATFNAYGSWLSLPCKSCLRYYISFTSDLKKLMQVWSISQQGFAAYRYLQMAPCSLFMIHGLLLTAEPAFALENWSTSLVSNRPFFSFVLCVTLHRAGAAYVWINMILINAFIGPSIMLIKCTPKVQTLIAAMKERMQRAKESILGTPTEEDQINSMYEETLAYTTATQQELVTMFASFSTVIVFGML